MRAESTSLSWDVHVAPSEPLNASELAPGEQAPSWSPISSTLIFGERDAVLVDALLTVGQAHDLVEWIDGARKEPHDRVHHARSRRSLVRTERGPQSLSRRPRARPSRLSSSRCDSGPAPSSWSHSGHHASVTRSRESSTSPTRSKTTRSSSRATSSSPSSSATPTPTRRPACTSRTSAWSLPATSPTTTFTSTSPSRTLSDGASGSLRSTRSSLSTRRSVIAGHQRAGRHDGPEIIEETRQYIRDFDRIAETTNTARDLYDQVLAIYPDRINPDALRLSAQRVKPSGARQ